LEDPMDALEEHDIELHPVDNTPCRTYFYNVNSEESIRYARAFSGRNKDSIAQLLLGFFQYFAWDFDFKHDVVSTTHSPQSISKITKAEQDCWTQHDRLRFVHILYTSNLYLVL
jgi:DNA polymerase sigma